MMCSLVGYLKVTLLRIGYTCTESYQARVQGGGAQGAWAPPLEIKKKKKKKKGHQSKY